jgi:hypothetical protein
LAQGEAASDEDGLMPLRLGSNIKFDVPSPVSVVAMIDVPASRVAHIRE